DVLASTGLYDALGRGTEIRHHRARLKQHSGDTVDAICNAYPVAVDGKTLGAVLTFQRLDDVSRFTYEIWEHENRATSFDDIIGDSQPMSSVKEFAAKIASGDSTVLLRGESGTGKGLMARAIHRASRRKDGPFVVVNCSAIPDTLLESELFGYEEGAFTGARKKGKLGRFELANNGTLFLDEIGDMPLHLQGKLLRALEDRMIEPVGSVESRPIDVRIIGATNRDTMVASREFRKDLFYRLNVVPIWMPSLRERRDDIPMLTQFFLDKHCGTVGKNISAFSDGALQCMLAYEWPGNVRELSNSVEYAVNIESESTVQITSLPQRVRTVGRPVGFDEADSPQALEALERQAIAEALRRFE
ncbi:sigma-54 interaction domain-containing protein, partial [Candidatus Skiveiella danica]|uniref:sigma-54 interaction domain-containing protein n=1 Tax=Candidatus Skiveiella danica TaxID=3386177 RepID=UPI0039B90671